MIRTLWIAVLAAAFAISPAAAGEKRSAARKKAETGASCKAPAVGRCAACNITCQVGESAQCGGGVAAADRCHTQPVCKCTK